MNNLARKVWVMQCVNGNTLEKIRRDVFDHNYCEGTARELGVSFAHYNVHNDSIVYNFVDGSELVQKDIQNAEQESICH